jgi:hypothetical protein
MILLGFEANMAFFTKLQVAFAPAILMLVSCCTSSYAGFLDFDLNEGARGKYPRTEKADTDIYGETPGGLLHEAADLRIRSEFCLGNNQIDKAVAAARKAAQLDPDSTDSHVVLAKALTAKIYAADFDVPESVYKQCLHEWQVVRWHSADTSAQSLAGDKLAKIRWDSLSRKWRRKHRERDVDAVLLTEKPGTNQSQQKDPQQRQSRRELEESDRGSTPEAETEPEAQFDRLVKSKKPVKTELPELVP